MAFFTVYILEAHASDVWQMSVNTRQKVVIASPRTIEERSDVATACVRNLHLDMPALLDNFQNTTEHAYTGWPDRLYVIDRNGRVAYKSQAGPFGFRPQEVAAKLEEIVAHSELVAAR